MNPIFKKILFPFECILFIIVVGITAIRMKLDKNFKGW